jgi:hypothetical protein
VARCPGHHTIRVIRIEWHNGIAKHVLRALSVGCRLRATEEAWETAERITQDYFTNGDRGGVMAEIHVIQFYPQPVVEALTYYHERLGRLYEIHDFSKADVPYEPEIEAYLIGRAAVIATELGIEPDSDGRD